MKLFEAPELDVFVLHTEMIATGTSLGNEDDGGQGGGVDD